MLFRKWRLHPLWGVFLLVTTAPFTGLAAQPTVALTNNGISFIQILGSGSIPPDTVSAVKATSAEGILPYSVVVRNTGSLPITGLDILYNISANGKEVPRDFFYLSPGDVADATSQPVIPPGGEVVLSPYHALNQALLGGNVLSLPGRDVAGIKDLVSFLDGSTHVAVSVDSVIRSDGTIVGPDRSLRYQSIQDQIRAYTEFRDELLKRFADGETDAQIASWLQQTASQHIVRSTNSPEHDRGLMLKKAAARRYLGYLAQGQRQQALEALKEATTERALGQVIKVHQEVSR